MSDPAASGQRDAGPNINVRPAKRWTKYLRSMSLWRIESFIVLNVLNFSSRIAGVSKCALHGGVSPSFPPL